MTAAVALFAVLVVLFVAFSARMGKAYLTGPLLFLVAGVLVARTDLYAGVDHAVFRTIAQVTLALLQSHDASQLQPRELRAAAALTGRLLLIGLPLTVGAGYLLAHALFPGIGVWLALLLAAALAPTDAGLGAATVLNPVVPVRVRRVLNVESGLNDGLATPIVLFAVAATAGFADGSTEHALVKALGEIAVGALVGAAAGYLVGRLLDLTHDRGWSDASLVPVAVVAVPMFSYYAAHGVGGNGFIAAFVAGTMFAFAQVDLDRMHAHLELTDQVATLLGFGVWMLFATTLGTHLREVVTWQTIVFAVLSLTVLRMVPVALSLLGSGLRPPSVLFIGRFGPRGLASVVFGLIALESLDEDSALFTAVGVISTTVVLSVIAHGVTATPWARRYGAWASGPAHPQVEMQGTVAPRRTRGGS
jgi:NhaP-type Na+/H+ or K+/H+ antiporter